MKLILHIGTEKTGSTSLQRWLTANSEALRNQGIWYSSVLGRQDNRLIAVYARDSDKPDDGFAKSGIHSEKDHELFRRRLEKEFSNEVMSASSRKCRSFIISSEHLHSRITSSEMVGRVKCLVGIHFEEIEVICYLRPQAHLLQSRLSVGIRNFTFGPHEFRTFEEEYYYNFNDLVDRWREHFENVKFLPFVRMPNIINDMSKLIGVDGSKLSAPDRVNEKLDYRTGNLVYNLQQNSIIKAENLKMLRINVNSLPVRDPILISRKLAKEIQDKYHLSNVLVAKKCARIELADLEPDIESFPVSGTAEKMLDLWQGRDMLACTLFRQNCLSRIDRLQIQLLICELDAVNGNLILAREKLEKISMELGESEEVVGRAMPELFRKLKTEFNRLKNQVNT